MASITPIALRSAAGEPSASAARAHSTRIVSVVCVVDARVPDPIPTLTAVHDVMRELATPIELVVVLNGVGAALVEQVQGAAEKLACVQVYVLENRTLYSTALLAGLENAIGDWISTIDLSLDEPAVVRQLFEAANSNHFEVVLGVAPGLRRAPLDALLSAAFHRLFKMLHGFELSLEAPTARMFSRAVLNRVLRHDSPLVALETLTALGAYRKTIVPCRRRAGLRPPLKERILNRWRTLIGLNAMPLRLANLLCAAGAFAAMTYSVYVVVIYLIKQDVVPGWTTVSLILSAMFMMISLVLWLLSEYMILLLDAGARRPRYEMALEFGSRKHSLHDTLNVEAKL